MNIKKIKSDINNRVNKAEEILDIIYNRINDDNLNDYITLTKNHAYQSAENSQKRISKNADLSLIDGIPVSLKDNFSLINSRMTCGSRILEDYIAPYNSTVAERIINKGGLIVGKTNLDEFAMGSSTETSYFGHSVNPIDASIVPGGSSGGSAVSVKAQHAALSVGSDTGGSVRQPAACCSVVGFKPSYGVVSRYGLTSFSSSLDTVGIMGNNVHDTNTLFDIIRGTDKYDSTVIDIEKKNMDNKIIGYIENIEGLCPNIAAIYRKKIEQLQSSDYKCIPIEIPYLMESIAIYQIISMCEASSNLARYDGIKYGLQTEEARSMFEIYSKVRGKGFGKEVKRRIMTGTYFLSYDNAKYYLMSLEMRKKLYTVMKGIFNSVSYIVIPTTMKLPFKIGERIDDPLKMHMSDSLTAFCNLANLPAISLPAGYSDNLPVGIQVIADSFNDINLMETAEYIEKIWGE